MATKLTKTQVEHIAKLVNLPLIPEEIDKFSLQLSEAASYVEVLRELELDNKPQTAQVTGLTNVFRNDDIRPSFTQEQALANAKDTYEGYFAVPAVIEKE